MYKFNADWLNEHKEKHVPYLMGFAILPLVVFMCALACVVVPVGMFVAACLGRVTMRIEK